jgi:hypothetical protein
MITNLHKKAKITQGFMAIGMLLSFSSLAQRPEFGWAKVVDSAAPSRSVKDKKDNLYYVGSFTGRVDIDPSPDSLNVNGPGIFIQKLNPLGTLVWAKSISGRVKVHDIEIDNLDDIYISGDSEPNIDFDPGTGTQISEITNSRSVFIQKINTNGDLIWVKFFSGSKPEPYVINPGRGISPGEIAVDKFSNVYLTGRYDSVDFDPGPSSFVLTTDVFGLFRGMGYMAFVLKLDQKGNFLWVKNTNGEGVVMADGELVATDMSGNLIVAGSYSGTIDFDPGPGIYNLSTPTFSSSASSDIFHSYFLQKLDGNGNLIWAKSLNCFGKRLELTQIDFDQSSQAVIGGRFHGTMDFDPGNGVYIIQSSVNDGNLKDLFIEKLDVNGSFLWARVLKSLDDDILSTIELDQLGNVYSAGWMGSLPNFDGKGIANVAVGVFVIKLDKNGRLKWIGNIKKALRHERDTKIIAHTINVDRFSGITITGTFDNSFDFDPGENEFVLKGRKANFICRWNQK